MTEVHQFYILPSIRGREVTINTIFQQELNRWMKNLQKPVYIRLIKLVHTDGQ